MPSAEVERHLAVIWAADVAGYSRLMSDDDEATLTTLATYQEVIAGFVAEHLGRIFGMAGDSIMAEFASAVQAVRCAVAVQRALKRRNADLPERRRMVFRIGLNLSDVLGRGGDLYGDGVNVAARLEALAGPGQICISASVHEQIADKLNFACEFLGERTVKNIARPVRVYSVDWSLAAPVPVSQLQSGPLTLPDRPSIVVLPSPTSVAIQNRTISPTALRRTSSRRWRSSAGSLSSRGIPALPTGIARRRSNRWGVIWACGTCSRGAHANRETGSV